MPPPPDDKNKGGGWEDFLNPKKESESLRRARDFMSEQSLPLSFDPDADDDNVDDSTTNLDASDDDTNAKDENSKPEKISSALAASTIGPVMDAPSAEVLAKNPYMQVVSKLSPSELISKFTATANPRVQGAVRNTILGLIGNLPKMAFDTTTITTGQRLASLMFQLQMTGYMFKNADYRLSLDHSLGTDGNDTDSTSSQYRLSGSDSDGGNDGKEPFPADGKVKGKLKLKYGGTPKKNKTNEGGDAMSGDDDDSSETEGGTEMEVDAAAYMSELRSEVQQLRDELQLTQQSKEEEVRKDLLLYIRTLPEQELRSLTNTMSPDVLVSMKGLVNAVMSGIGEGQITANTVTEQSGEAMAQLCMWQLVVGYNLRELEVREEMKKTLSKNNGSSSSSSSSNTDGDDTADDGIGAFE